MDPCSPAACSSSTPAWPSTGRAPALIILSELGNDPWDVLHQGLSRQTGIGTGLWVCIAGALVMLLWIPLRQRPGLGTLSNVVVVGLTLELCLAVLEPAHDTAAALDAAALGRAAQRRRHRPLHRRRASGPARATG